jgi:hypothetical protein
MSIPTRAPARSIALAVLAAILALPVLAARHNPERVDQQTFASPEEAAKALRDAATSKDTATLNLIFGPAAQDLVNPDRVQAASELDAFARHLAEMSSPVHEGDDRATLFVGRENWPFPIPLVRRDGRWLFDTAAGKEEILRRRIGGNELDTIAVCRAYVAAQREYHDTDWNGDDVLEYAQRLHSRPGAKDGLYWPAADAEPQSPFGPLAAQAQAEGYLDHANSSTPSAQEPSPSPAAPSAPPHRHPYHGYYFKVLTAQGDAAPGGRYSYIINGHMVAGFALIAYPEEWGNTGIMTFIVAERGKVYQKNLGPQTTDQAGAITEFDPDGTWELAQD